jgi:hypothetical protein
VPNAKAGSDSVDISVVGMAGIPESAFEGAPRLSSKRSDAT